MKKLLIYCVNLGFTCCQLIHVNSYANVRLVTDSLQNDLSHQKNIVKEKSHDISREKADTMVKSFRVKLGFYRRRTSSWFPRDLFDKLDAAIRAAGNKPDGFRVYVGKEGKIHTFLIVPTRDDGPNPDSCTTCRNCPAPNFKPIMRYHADDFDAVLPEYTYAVHLGKAENGVDEGATLYQRNACSGTGGVLIGINGGHGILCSEASEWVRHRVKIGLFVGDRVNTYSEWFEPKFIKQIKKDLDTPTSSGALKDGVRIYLSRQVARDCQKRKRHAFLFVSTYLDTIKKGTISHIDDYNNSAIDKGTYDNGEQCLNNCHSAKLPSY